MAYPEESSSCRGIKDEYNVVIEPHPRGAFTRCVAITLSVMIFSAIIAVYPVVDKGSRWPETQLEALSMKTFTASEARVGAKVTGWFINANITVTLQARNPSTVIGFRHRYLSTLVSASSEDTLRVQSLVPEFSLGHKSSRNVTANLIIHDQYVNRSGALVVREYLYGWTYMNITSMIWSIGVDTRVKRKTKDGWQAPRWFNSTCWVNVSMPSTSEAGQLLSKSDYCLQGF